MNTCEFCDENFPNITELYKHKYKMHQHSIVLHNHKKAQSTKPMGEYRNDPPKVEYKNSMDAVEYRNNLPKVEYKETAVKRKRDLDSDSDDIYTAKRFRDDSDSEYRATGLEVVPYVKPRKKKPKTKRKFIKAKSDGESDLENKRIEKYRAKIERVYKDGLSDQKEKYEDKMSKREDELDLIKKQCEEHIANREKEFIEKQNDLKKDLEEHKENYQGIMSEMEDHYQNQIKILNEKIKATEENDASFKPLSDAIFNCITIEEIFKIKKLVRNREFEELIKNHLDTLQKLFLSLSYGVIPICQPQRDVMSDSQKNLIKKIETSTPSKAKTIIMQNRSDIVNIFDIIDQSLELATVAYDRFRRL